MPTDECVVAARGALAQYIKRENTNPNAIARRFGVPQYTLWRFLAGHTKSIPANLAPVLSYAGIAIDRIPGPVLREDERLQRALLAAWDGTPDGVVMLTRLLEAIGPVLRAVSGRPCP